jgi:hypothetical protein
VDKPAIAYIKQLREGQANKVYPYSMDFGNSFNAIRFPCPGRGSDPPIEFREPFKAQFLSYSGTVIKVRTRKYQCLLMDFDFIREVKPAN